MLIKTVLWALLAICTAARAEVSCPSIYDRPSSADNFFLLAFVGGASASASGVDAKLRRSKLGQLEARLTPKLQDYAYGLAQRLSVSAPSIILVTCDFPLNPTDLDRADLAKLSRRNVLATFWSSDDGEKASIVHVSLPHYQRRSGSRREVEVSWLRPVVTSDDLADWANEFSRNSATQQTLLAMAVGFAALKRADLPLAKLSFCQVRSNLSQVAQEVHRPAPAELQKEVERLLKEATDEIDAAARQKGIDLNSIPSIKLACGT